MNEKLLKNNTKIQQNSNNDIFDQKGVRFYEDDIEKIEAIKALLRAEGIMNCNYSEAVRIGLLGIDLENIDIKALYIKAHRSKKK